MEVLRGCEEAGLVHTSYNRQQIDYICNCCPCHCRTLKLALLQPKPGRLLGSGFRPVCDRSHCTACGICIDRCPTKGLWLNRDVPAVDLDRCIGCGVCATGCPEDAIRLVQKDCAVAPPVDEKALRDAIEAGSG